MSFKDVAKEVPRRAADKSVGIALLASKIEPSKTELEQ